MKKLVFSILALSAITANHSVAFPYCGNDWDCSDGKMCMQGICETQPQSESSTSSGSNGWQCRNDWDCSSAESCLAGICTSYSSGGDFPDPIYGG